MISLLDQSLTVDYKTFETWEDADKFCVSKIFRFSEQCGNSSISECIELVLNSSIISNNNIFTYMTFRTDNEIDFLKSIIDQYLESGLDMLETSSFENPIERETVLAAHQALLLLMAHSAIKLFENLQNHDSYKSFINVFLSETMIAETVARKQRDYGPNNVSKFGVSGLVVRIHDKIARLDNLLSSSRNGQNSVKNETVFDTLLDIVGYSTVSLLWVNGWFLTPMSIDKR
jgi:hypothetical protein